ncbi:MAG: glycosyltransferase family 4 protein [Candidatus Pacebacteria bacterium]|nr:glycosyltransferase family 4 protein [Candidatus Paceibacterota bacterium]
MKIHILYKFEQGFQGGGGNQFLKALKDEWVGLNVYEEKPEKADIILFNSHQNLKEVFKLKKTFPDKIFIHRIDGPIQAYRPKEKFQDKLIFKVNNFSADGTVWQSEWSKKENKKLLPFSSQYQTVVYNAANSRIFNKDGKKDFNPSSKIKLVTVSWSKNLLKGFDIYQYLDTHLDFKRYQMVFVGRSPVEFKNIKMVEPSLPEKIAEILKQSDIFVFASKVESCSNALIEALSVGLPCLAFNSSSNPEIIGAGGELFESPKELLGKIDKVAKNYFFYQKNLPVFSLERIARQYFNFAKQIFSDTQSGFYFPRQVGVQAALSFSFSRFVAFLNKAANKFF